MHGSHTPAVWTSSVDIILCVTTGKLLLASTTPTLAQTLQVMSYEDKDVAQWSVFFFVVLTLFGKFVVR